MRRPADDIYSSEDDPGVLATTIHLPPGTHHLKFIVDGEMRTTNDLPTAVDFTNVLVNYLEVSPEDMPKSRRESERGAKPIPQPLHPPLTWREYEVKESGVETPGADEHDMREPPEEEIPLGDFRQLVPQALIDMDLPEDDPKYQQAVNVIENVQGPPSLPLFLGTCDHVAGFSKYSAPESCLAAIPRFAAAIKGVSKQSRRVLC